MHFCAHAFPVAGEGVDSTGRMSLRALVSFAVLVVLLVAVGVQVAQAAVVVVCQFRDRAEMRLSVSCLWPLLWRLPLA